MLIFDSGIGGFSILNNIIKILPNKKYIYMLDNAGFPYGNKNSEFIIERSIKIIRFIQKKYPVTVVIIACNTASTITVSVLKKIFHIPIIGIFPDIPYATKITKNKTIGLIATEATINSQYIQKKINTSSFKSTIRLIANNQLAQMSEKKNIGFSIIKKELKNIFQPWITLIQQPDTIILGCTHFLTLKKEIQSIFSQSIHFIDSSKDVLLKIQQHFIKNSFHQFIKENIFLYSKEGYKLKKILFFAKKYHFQKIKKINLN